MTDQRTQLIDAYYAAMRRGPGAEADIVALFSDDVVYEEPFTSPGDPAVGIDAVIARLRAGWATPLPEMELDVLAIDVRGDTATTRWECRSPALPSAVSGSDTYTFERGRITRLVVELDPPT